MLLQFKTDSRLTFKDAKSEFITDNLESAQKKVESEKIRSCLFLIVVPPIQTLVWQNTKPLTNVQLLLGYNVPYKINWFERIFIATCTVNRFVHFKILTWVFWIQTLDLPSRWNRFVSKVSSFSRQKLAKWCIQYGSNLP